VEPKFKNTSGDSR